MLGLPQLRPRRARGNPPARLRQLTLLRESGRRLRVGPRGGTEAAAILRGAAGACCVVARSVSGILRMNFLLRAQRSDSNESSVLIKFSASGVARPALLTRQGRRNFVFATRRFVRLARGPFAKRAPERVLTRRRKPSSWAVLAGGRRPESRAGAGRSGAGQGCRPGSLQAAKARGKMTPRGCQRLQMFGAYAEARGRHRRLRMRARTPLLACSCPCSGHGLCSCGGAGGCGGRFFVGIGIARLLLFPKLVLGSRVSGSQATTIRRRLAQWRAGGLGGLANGITQARRISTPTERFPESSVGVGGSVGTFTGSAPEPVLRQAAKFVRAGRLRKAMAAQQKAKMVEADDASVSRNSPAMLAIALYFSGPKKSRR